MRNQVALRALGLLPSDLFKYGSQERLGSYPGHPLDAALQSEAGTPFEARDTIKTPGGPIHFNDLGTGKELDHQQFLGSALLKMFLGSNLPTQPVAPYRATPPTLR